MEADPCCDMLQVLRRELLLHQVRSEANTTWTAGRGGALHSIYEGTPLSPVQPHALTTRFQALCFLVGYSVHIVVIYSSRKSIRGWAGLVDPPGDMK